MEKIKEIVKKIFSLSENVKAMIAFMICNFFQRGISVLTTPIFTRILSAEQYGYYSIFNSWLDIISVFATLKLGGSVYMQALVKYEDRKDEFTTSTMGLGTLSVVCFATIYVCLKKYINSFLGLNTFVVSMILILCWTGLLFELWSAQQRIEYKYKAFTILTIFTSILKPLFGILTVLLVTDFKVEGRIFSQTIIEVIAYFWIVILFMKRNRHLFNIVFWKYSLSLNIPLIPHYLTRIALNQCDRVMINYMVGYSAAGIYSLGHSLAWLLTLITNSILNTLNPWIFQCIKKKQYNKIGIIFHGLLILVAVTGLILIITAPEIVSSFAPEEYRDAIWVIPALCMSVYFMFLYSLFASFEYYFEKTNYLMIASGLGGILNVVLNYCFIKIFGMIAAGYTTLICYIFYAIVHFLCAKMILKKQQIVEKVYSINIIVAISTVFVCLGFGAMFIYNQPVIRYMCVFATIVGIIINKNRIKSIIYEIGRSSEKNKY